MGPKAYKSLLERIRELASDLRRIEFFAGTESGRRLDAVKARALELIDGKLLPELSSSLELPLFVAVMGGTNTGKSTTFNALAGVILSETKVVAGATKHPLVYVHRRWSKPLLSGRVFDRVRCVELDDPARTVLKSDERLMLFSFHDRPELEDTAFVDSPDLDSAEPKNREVAQHVLTQADVCLFVTTPQKYKDRVLVDDLAAMARLHKKVVVIFNFVDDEVLYRTMVEDMKLHVDQGVEHGGYLPTVETRQPERVLGERVNALVQAFLEGCPRERVKLEAVREGIAVLLEEVRELVDGYRAEAGHKSDVLAAVDKYARRAREEYDESFALSFPELAEALRRRLAALELRALVPRGKAPESQPRVVGLLYHGLGIAGETLTGLFADSLASQGPPEDWETFWSERDARDRLQIRQLGQLLRSRVDNHLRAAAPSSALSLSLLQECFTLESLERFEGELDAAHAEVADAERDVGRALLERTPDPRRGASGARALALGANGVKLATGLALAALTGGFGTWDLVFFPLGVLAGSYAIAVAIYWRLRLQRELFRRQRARWFQAVVDRCFVEPLTAVVENAASESDLSSLAAHCERIAKERP